MSHMVTRSKDFGGDKRGDSMASNLFLVAKVNKNFTVGIPMCYSTKLSGIIMDKRRHEPPTWQGVHKGLFWQALELVHVSMIKCGLKTSTTVYASVHQINILEKVNSQTRQNVTFSQYHGNKTSGCIVKNRAITSRVSKNLEVEDLAWKL